ncbi:MAG: hypothetical protein HY646_17655 [Acidobacteria bacterium]|nr:hypothetical protein [Acidobacteriota bacterium]
MSRRRSIGTIFWGLTLMGIGGLLLARNMGYSIPIWSALARYWPVLIIVWGLMKLVDYYRFKSMGEDRPLFSGGEVALLILVILAGSAITTAANISPELGEIFQIGDIDFWDITGNNYEYSERQEAAAAPDSTIEILNLYGNVEVAPADTDRITLEVLKTVRAASKEEADRLVQDFTFSIKNEGTRYRIISSRDENSTTGRIGFERQRFKSSMTLRVPRRSVLQLDNRNGNVSVSGLTGNQIIRNRYGKVGIRGITGTVEIENRNGSVEAIDVTQSAKITNSYSSVTATNIGGSLDVQNRNGSVEATTVKGNTTISNSYSSVEVRTVTGTLNIQNRNGTVTVEDVTDAAKISNSYANTTVKNVGGRLDVTARNGSVNVADIKGDAIISNSYAPITVTNIQGELRVEGRNNSVDIENVTGNLTIENSYQNVDVRDAKGAVTVRTRNGDVRIEYPQPPAKDVTVNAEYANVVVEMPSGSSFAVDARTRYGNVDSEFEGIRVDSDNRDKSINGRTGTGGPLIKIDTRNGDVRLERRG